MSDSFSPKKHGPCRPVSIVRDNKHLYPKSQIHININVCVCVNSVSVCMYVFVCVCVCVRACVRACVRGVCVRVEAWERIPLRLFKITTCPYAV